MERVVYVWEQFCFPSDDLVMQETNNFMTIRFLDVPTELVCLIISQWLELKDVPYLDSALCSKRDRPIWLTTVLGSSYCILSTVPDASFVSWVHQRNARVDELFMATCSDITACMIQSEKFGSYVHALSVQDVAMGEGESAQSIVIICSRCCNLTSLCFDDCRINESILEILNRAVMLKNLEFRNCWDFCKKDIFVERNWEACKLKNIRNVTLVCQENYSPVVNTVLRLLSPSNLRCLHVCTDTHIEMDNTLRLLKECGPHLKEFGFASPFYFTENDLIAVTNFCSQLLHLDISNLAEIQDETLATVARNLTHLRSLNISECSFTDVALVSLAEHRSDTLEALYAHDLDNISGAGLSAVLEKCPNLHTLAFDTVPHVMSGLNTPLFGKLTTLRLAGTSVAHCQSILAHCTSLQQLRPSSVCMLGLAESDSFYTEHLPALRTLTVPRLYYVNTVADVPKLAKLQAVRPQIRIIFVRS